MSVHDAPGTDVSNRPTAADSGRKPDHRLSIDGRLVATEQALAIITCNYPNQTALARLPGEGATA